MVKAYLCIHPASRATQNIIDQIFHTLESLTLNHVSLVARKNYVFDFETNRMIGFVIHWLCFIVENILTKF